MQNQTNSNPQAAEWLGRAAKLKEETLVRLESLVDAQRKTAPSPSEWSASEVVAHLILVEENIAGLWRQRLLDVPNAKPSIKSELLSNIVSFVFSKTGIRVPTFPELEPREQLGVNELRAQWDTAREKLLSALPNDPNAAWILHPAFGVLSSAQMGRLLTSHLEHHLRVWPLE